MRSGNAHFTLLDNSSSSHISTHARNRSFRLRASIFVGRGSKILRVSVAFEPWCICKALRHVPNTLTRATIEVHPFFSEVYSILGD